MLNIKYKKIENDLKNISMIFQKLLNIKHFKFVYISENFQIIRKGININKIFLKSSISY